VNTDNSPKGFFRCPHCRQKTITAWTKLRTRGACPGCGGFFVAGSWGILLAVFVMPLTMFAPMFVLRPIGYPLTWLAFAVGSAFTLALSGVIYLFTTSLYRKGSVAARWDAIALFTFLAAATVAALMNTDFDREAGLSPHDFTPFRIGSSSPPRVDTERITSSVHHGHTATQQVFKDALDEAGIPYELETREGKEFVGWTRAHDAAVRKIQRRLDGADLPSRRSVSFDNPGFQKEFIAWLTGKGVKHETKKSYGREYVVWQGPDDLLRQFMREKPSDCEKTAAAAGARISKC